AGDGGGVVDTGANNTLTVAELQGLVFTPNDLTGDGTVENFTYTVTDTGALSDTATIAITVNDDAGAPARTITGGTGDDILIGGAGNDTLTGGAGADLYIASSGEDTIFAGDGLDTFRIGTEFSFEGGRTDTNGDLVIYYEDAGYDIHETTIVNQVVDQLGWLEFDYDDDGALDMFSMAVTVTGFGTGTGTAVADTN
ncbi:MAG: hypothetical protein QGH60_25125, partial [Phycisphaerae bacterium]|nr:hypothetical protein [Phycisphaerae bacterium]